MTGTTGSTVKQYRTALSLVERGKVELSSLITHRFPIHEVSDAIESVRAKNGLKTILEPNELP